MNNPNVLIASEYGPIIININDYGVGKNISQTGYHSKDDIELIKELLNYLYAKKESLLFYDVGANIGTHSLALSKTYGSNIKIRAFEAQRQVFNMLCGTVALNGINNIFCYNVAVSNEEGKLISIELPNYGETNNFGGLELIQPIRSDNFNMKKMGIEEIQTTTLDSFDEVVDFIKLDIEGMEDRAIKGAELILRKHKPICFIEILKTDLEFLIRFFTGINYIGFQKNADLIAIPSEYNLQIKGLNRIF